MCCHTPLGVPGAGGPRQTTAGEGRGRSGQAADRGSRLSAERGPVTH